MAVAGVGAKRKRHSLSSPEWFAEFAEAHPEVDGSRVDQYLASGVVWCTYCGCFVSVASSSNWDKHVHSVGHKCAAARLSAKAAKGGPVQTQLQLVAMTASAANKTNRAARALLTAVFSRHTSPVQIPLLWAPDVVAAVYKLQAKGVAFGTAGTRSRDARTALAALDKAVDDLLADGCPVTLHIDGASLDMLGGTEKPVAVLISCRNFNHPVLLTIAMLKDGSAVALAKFLLALLDKRDIDLDRVVCLMGDNVTFNDAVAREINVMRAKWVPHILSLCTKDFTGVFPALATMTVHLHSFTCAAGSTPRTTEMDKLAQHEGEVLPCGGGLQCQWTAAGRAVAPRRRRRRGNASSSPHEH